MGKGRLSKVRERQGETKITMEERKQRSVLAKTKDKIFSKMEEGYDANTAKTRAKYLPRWREMTGKGPNELPDYTDPRVHLEFFLCDLKVQLLLVEGRREEVLAMMDDQQR